MAITYRSAIERITIGQALKLYHEHEVCVIIDEGQHVTLADED
jgi:hypothetical protein